VRLKINIACMLLVWLVVPWHHSGDRGFSQEPAARRAISQLHAAEVQYYSQYGRYACSVEELGLPAFQYGYEFSLRCTAGGYEVHATPEVHGATGNKAFFSDQTMVIHKSASPAPAIPTGKEIRSHRIRDLCYENFAICTHKDYKPSPLLVYDK
jgi:type IV pilus assembly protein PilA